MPNSHKPLSKLHFPISSTVPKPLNSIMFEPTDSKVLEFFKIVFATYDKNSDGTIDTAELGNVLQSLGRTVSDERLSELIKEFDLDRNGKIDWTNGEFLMVVGTIDVADVNIIDDFV